MKTNESVSPSADGRIIRGGTARAFRRGGMAGLGAMALFLATSARVPATDYYVATNGDNTAHNSWSTAYTNIQDALNTAVSNDTIYLAGHAFFLTNQLVWTSSCSYVAIRGGYVATNTVDLPGPYDAQLWPTMMTRAAGCNVRILLVANVTNGTLERATLTGGIPAAAGGGLYISTCTGMLFSTCVITNNSESSYRGGGIYLIYSIVTVSNCLVEGNTSAGAGGGICLDSSGTMMTLRDSIIAYNRGNSEGGGIFNYGTSLIKNCLLQGNSRGPGIASYGGSVSLDNCTVAHNAGQGISRQGGAVIVTNSIVWGNGDDIVGSVTLAWSDIEDGDSGTGCISADPLFEYGYYLATNSPCVDAGTNSASDQGLSGYTTRTDGSNDSGRVDLGYHYSTGFDLSYADLYAAPGGDDGNSGTNWAQAFRTIKKAFTVTRDGSHIHAAAGTYTTASGEIFPLTMPYYRAGVQVLGTNRATTVISAAGSAQRVMTVSYCANVKVEEVTLTGGIAGSGGGLYIGYCGDVLLSGCVITNNSEPSYRGGGIYSTYSVVTVSNCVVQSNTASDGGGGLCLEVGTTMTLRDSIIANNKAAANGGGIFNYGTCLMKNCLLYGNSATDAGVCSYSASVVSLDNCTVANNAGRGISRQAGAIGVTNSIVWGNTDDIFGTVSLAYSDIKDGDNNGTNGCISANPRFVNTNAANYRPIRISPCVNTGTNQSWMAGASDLDGNPRIQGGVADMGPYETNTPPKGTIFSMY